MTDDSQVLAQYKLVLLYILENDPDYFTNDSLTTYVLKNDIMNYFYFKQFLMELEESGLVTERPGGLLEVTDQGREALDYFSHSIADQLLNKAKDPRIQDPKGDQVHYTGSFVPPRHVELLAYNQDRLVFNLTLTVDSEAQALDLVDRFKIKGKKAIDRLIDCLKEDD